ncbi:MAG: hypothetical protein WD342_05105 [Verrucomicrobiales bacterium]
MDGTTSDADSVEVIAAPGRLPVFPERNAVFVANLLGLFFGNEEQTRMLAEEVGELDSYGGRLIPVVDLLFPGAGSNLLALERVPDPALCRYFEETAGLSLPDRFILPHAEYLEIGRALEAGKPVGHEAFKQLEEHPSAFMDGYVTDETLSSLARATGKRTISSVEGSHGGNNKRALHQHLEAVGLPVVTTELAESPAHVAECLGRLAAAGFTSGVVKAAIGASGIGLVKVASLEDVDSIPEIPEHFFREGPCLVQGWLKPGEMGVLEVRSPSVQMFLDEKSVTLYDLTEQILSRFSIHEGNEAPPPYLFDRPELRRELLRQAGEAAKWLHRRGYRGTGSVDFLAVDYEDGRSVAYVCEINARVTGATYPAVLARHLLPDGAWLLRNFRFDNPLPGDALLKALRNSGDLFVPGEAEVGVLPVNFNFGPDGLVHKGQFLCLAHSTAGSRVVLDLAKADLPCASDRD